MIENRRQGSSERVTRNSDLPVDFLRMVTEVFTTHFDPGLLALRSLDGRKTHHEFEASGAIFPNEVVLQVSLRHPDDLAATTIHASMDFDPKASSPTVQDLLSCCVDAAATVFEWLFSSANPERVEAIASHSLAALEDVPFQWTEVEVNQRTAYVKVDKSNPKLDAMADDWLAQNDPNHQKRIEEEQRATEKLFVTGKPKAPPSTDGGESDGGTLH